MKTALGLTVATLVLTAFRLSAQTSAQLIIQMYAGLTITGTGGTV